MSATKGGKHKDGALPKAVTSDKAYRKPPKMFFAWSNNGFQLVVRERYESYARIRAHKMIPDLMLMVYPWFKTHSEIPLDVQQKFAKSWYQALNRKPENFSYKNGAAFYVPRGTGGRWKNVPKFRDYEDADDPAVIAKRARKKAWDKRDAKLRAELAAQKADGNTEETE